MKLLTVKKRLAIEVAVLIIGLILARFLIGIPLGNSLEENSEEFVKNIIQIPQDAQKEEFQLTHEVSWIAQESGAELRVRWNPFLRWGPNFEISIDSVIPREKFGVEIDQVVPQETLTKISRDQLTAIKNITKDPAILNVVDGLLSESLPLYREQMFQNQDGLEEVVVHTSGMRAVYKEEKILGNLGSDYRKLKILQPQLVSEGILPLFFGRNIISDFIVQGFQFSPNKFGVFALIVSVIPLFAFPLTFFIVRYSWFQRFILPEFTFLGLFWLLTIISNFVFIFIGVLFFSTG